MRKSFILASAIFLTSCAPPANITQETNQIVNNQNSISKVEAINNTVSKPEQNGMLSIKDNKMTLTIAPSKLGFKTKVFNPSDVATVKVEIKNTAGTVTGIGTATYDPVNGTTLSASLNNMAFNKLYIATMRAIDSTGNEIIGAEVKNAFILTPGNQTVKLNYSTTPTARVLEAIMAVNPTLATSISINIAILQEFIDDITGVTNTFPNFIYNNIHPTRVNTQQIANDLLNNTGDIDDLNSSNTAYISNNTSSVKVNIEGLVSTDKVTIGVSDPSSPTTQTVSNGVTTFNNISVGSWKTSIIQKSDNGTTYTLSQSSPINSPTVANDTKDIGTVTLSPATPTITSVTDTSDVAFTSADPGTTIKIKGTNFHKVKAGNTVKFGTVTATLVSVNANGTEITATVPNGNGGINNITVGVGTSVSTEYNFNINILPIFVSASAVSGGDGTSWNTAYNDLQTAITNATSGQQIWVKAGTYKTTTGTDRTISFQMKDGVAIYGGFAGTEANNYNLSQRDIKANLTTLSGEIGAAGNGDNAYHVVTAVTGSILDGVTISDGNANGTTDDNGIGGGIFVNTSQTPVLNNLIITSNSAGMTEGGGGGGMAVKGTNLSINNLVFLSNISTSGAYGGALLISDNATLDVTRCYFLSNEAGDGAAIAKLNSTLKLTNSVLAQNQMATREGGGLYLSGTSTGTSGDDIVINNTFYNNTAGTTESSTMSLLNGATVLFKNNIVPNNSIKTASGTTFTYGNNLVGSTITAAGTVTDLGGNITTNVNPVYNSTFSYAGTDGKYFTADDGYNLKSTNPVAINDGGTTDGAPSVDITGVARPNSSRPANTVTLGAFEKQ